MIIFHVIFDLTYLIEYLILNTTQHKHHPKRFSSYDLEKHVVSEPIKMIQEFCYFDSRSPWEELKWVQSGTKK